MSKNAREGRGYKKAEELAEKFHGRESRGATKVTEKLRYTKNLAELGDLDLLGILTDPNKIEGMSHEDLEGIEEEDFDSYAIVAIYFPNGVKLAATPSGNQLMVISRKGEPIQLPIGELEWITGREKSKPKIPLGEIFCVGYFTDKHHLEGPEEQKDGVPYIHMFGTKTGIRPIMIYDQVNHMVEIIGGDYVVDDIGIIG